MELKVQTIEDARKDSVVQYERSQLPGVLSERYEAAVAVQDVEEAADAARALRNKMLDDCDNMLVPDRPNVDVDAWKAYRQALRDVPEQEGFPLVIDWPVAP